MAAGVLFSVAVLAPLDPGMGAGDASWFLQVACRLASGEVLYRDVFYGAGPVTPYLASFFARISGGEMIALRFLQLLLFGGIAFLVWSTLRRAGVHARWQLPAFGALVVYGFDPAFSLYNILSGLLLVCVMRAALEYHWSGADRWLWIAGALAGFEIGAKQNVAVLAALPLMGVVALHRDWRGGARAAAAFVGAVAAVLALVAFSGGWAKYVEYGFTAKGKYLASGLSWIAAFRQYEGAIRDSVAWTHRVRLSYALLAWAAALLLAIVSALACVRTRGEARRESLIAGSFVTAAALSIYPIFDLSHLAYAFPVLLIAGVMAAQRMRFSERWLTFSTAWFVPGLLWVALSPALFAATGQMTWFRLPHYRVVPVRTADYAVLVSKVESLRPAAVAGRRPFIISLFAGFYYLTTGLRNPTPYDYPAAAAFGLEGEAGLINALRSGEIPEACLDPEYEGLFLAPRALIGFVRAEMRPQTTVAACTFYGR